MKRIVVGLAVLLTACGGDSPTAPSTVSLYFKVDAQTCIGTASVNFYVDGSLAGTESMPAGSTSKAYAVGKGAHVIGASVANTNSRIWGPYNVTLSGDFTQVLACS